MSMSHRPRPSEPAPDVVLPLEPGDRLSREEFERRYEAMPHLKKAELIEGVVFMPSPVRLYRHSTPHFQLVTWLGVYTASTPGLVGGDNATARLDTDNEPQPDVLLLIHPERGGQARISADDYVEHAPELVAEVAANSASLDLHTKLNVYRRNGVREYLVWRVLEQQFDWFVLRAGQYQPLCADGRGTAVQRSVSRLVAGRRRVDARRHAAGAGCGAARAGQPGIPRVCPAPAAGAAGSVTWPSLAISLHALQPRKFRSSCGPSTVRKLSG